MFFKTNHSDLPAAIGVFPLDSVILLPRMQLTLNVFEQRYLNLVEDALHNRRLLAIVQPKYDTEEDAPIATETQLFSVGGLGRIVAFQEDSERLLISVEGICRAKLGREESTDRGYRIFTADYKEFADDFISTRDNFLKREKVMPIVERYMKFLGVNLPVDNLAHISDERLIYSIAMLSNFERSEKQALLECLDTGKQAEMLVTLMIMAVEGAGEGHDII